MRLSAGCVTARTKWLQLWLEANVPPWALMHVGGVPRDSASLWRPHTLGLDARPAHPLNPCPFGPTPLLSP